MAIVVAAKVNLFALLDFAAIVFRYAIEGTGFLPSEGTGSAASVLGRGKVDSFEDSTGDANDHGFGSQV